MSLIEKNNHENNSSGPGSKFIEKGIKEIVPPNKMHIHNFFSDMHYHLYVKYGLADAILNNSDNIDLWKEIYEKMQKQRVGSSKFNKFEKLINNIYDKGYDFGESIPVDNAFNILDGSHRLGVLAALGKNPIVKVLNYPSHDYSRQWFLQEGFSNEEINLIDNAKRKFFQKNKSNINKHNLGFIWGSTIRDLGNSWDEVIDEIGENNLVDFYIRNFGTVLANIIDLAYLDDGIDSHTLRTKNDWITKRSGGLLGIISYKDKGRIVDIKTKVRDNIYPKLSEYIFDSIIHSVDEIHPLSNKIRLQVEKIEKAMNALLYIN